MMNCRPTKRTNSIQLQVFSQAFFQKIQIVIVELRLSFAEIFSFFPIYLSKMELDLNEIDRNLEEVPVNPKARSESSDSTNSVEG
jgi:hypothetical protein